MQHSHRSARSSRGTARSWDVSSSPRDAVPMVRSQEVPQGQKEQEHPALSQALPKEWRSEWSCPFGCHVKPQGLPSNSCGRKRMFHGSRQASPCQCNESSNDFPKRAQLLFLNTVLVVSTTKGRCNKELRHCHTGSMPLLEGRGKLYPRAPREATLYSLPLLRGSPEVTLVWPLKGQASGFETLALLGHWLPP